MRLSGNATTEVCKKIECVFLISLALGYFVEFLALPELLDLISRP